MLEQIQIRKQLDSNEITYHDAYENPNNPPPIFPDAVLHVDENHTIASLGGGAGHDRSFARMQYFVTVDRRTAALKRKSEGGVILQQRFCVVAKYTTEAHGAYGVCCPIIDSEERPQFMKTWDYTGKNLCHTRFGKKKKGMRWHISEQVNIVDGKITMARIPMNSDMVTTGKRS